MKILILTMTCGQGHNAIANSIKNAFNETTAEVEVFDIFGKTPKESLKLHNAYMWAIKNIPYAYEFFWNIFRNKNPKNRYSGVNISYIKNVKQYNLNKILEFAPDAIITTHNYASNMCCYFKNKGEISKDIKIYSVLTDYCACPYWETSVLSDVVFTPNELTHAELISKGFKKEQLVATGYPTNVKFDKQYDRLGLRKKFGFEKNDFCVLAMAGGYGQGNLISVVKFISKIRINILSNLKLVVVCGKNKRQKLQIEKYINKQKIKNIIVLGFINNIEEYMSACDVSFTRGGGNTLSECFQMGLVPIVREKQIINERINKNIFLAKDMCYGIDSLHQLKKILYFIIKHPEDLKTKKDNIAKFRTNGATKNIVNYVLDNSEK